MADDQKPDKNTGKKPVWAVQGYLVSHPSQRFAPPTDIIELEDSIVVLVEIAGMNGDGFKIALHSQALVISGTRERLTLGDDAAYHQAEIGFGEFRLSVPMPWSVERDQVSAGYNNGFLRVNLPRQKARRVHIVDVNTDNELS